VTWNFTAPSINFPSADHLIEVSPGMDMLFRDELESGIGSLNPPRGRRIQCCREADLDELNAAKEFAAGSTLKCPDGRFATLEDEMLDYAISVCNALRPSKSNRIHGELQLSDDQSFRLDSQLGGNDRLMM
jgi:hypothetical protein